MSFPGMPPSHLGKVMFTPPLGNLPPQKVRKTDDAAIPNTAESSRDTDSFSNHSFPTNLDLERAFNKHLQERKNNRIERSKLISSGAKHNTRPILPIYGNDNRSKLNLQPSRERTLNDLLFQIENKHSITLSTLETLSKSFNDSNGFQTRNCIDSGCMYYDVRPYDHTLVSEGDDFFNANYITLGEKVYIAGQAPMESCFYNFWKMICDNSTAVIVMLTELEEPHPASQHLIKKAYRYWPNEQEKELIFRPQSIKQYIEEELISVQFITEECISEDIDFNQPDYEGAKRQFIMKSLFNIRYRDKENQWVERNVTLIRYRFLYDMGAPETEIEKSTFIRLLDEVNHLESLNPKSKTVVHCSAGVGRTGMYIACDHLKSNSRAQTQWYGTREIAKLILKMRSQRPHMVQKSSQFELIQWFSQHLNCM